jgi:adenylate cyclase
MRELDFQRRIQEVAGTVEITRNEPDGLLEQLRALDGLLASLPIVPREPSLIFRDPAGSVQVCGIGAGLVFGRSPECQVLFAGYREISKRHFEIKPVESEYVLRDLGSTNGTFVNFDPAPVEQRLLIDGDLIRVGAFRLAFIRAQGADPPDSEARPPT